MTPSIASSDESPGLIDDSRERVADFQHDRMYGTVRVVNPFVDIADS
jgi:hypothetical protein